MNRFSVQQSRIGAFVGTGMNYVAAKTALTRSQWLMLITFAFGAVTVGFISTRWSKPQPSRVETSIGAKDQAGPAPAKYVSPSMEAPQSSEIASAKLIPPAPAAVAPRPAKSDIADPEEARSAPAVDPSTRSLLDGLAKEIAKINQKLDDLAGKQRQTANRLAALTADGKPSRNRTSDNADADRPGSSDRKPAANAASKVAKVTPLPPSHDLTVHRKAQRPKEIALQRLAAVKAVILERRVRIAERNRKVRQRRLASRSIFGRPFF